MGIGHFLKRKSGGYKLPPSSINEAYVIDVLKRQMPFYVVLPILETVKTGRSRSISQSHGRYRQTYHTPAEKKQVFRSIHTNIVCEPSRVVIQHARKNGQHMFLKYSDISKVYKINNGKINNGVLAEHKNGKQYQFLFTKDYTSAWHDLGFNPEFPIDVFYRFLLGGWRTVFP